MTQPWSPAPLAEVLRLVAAANAARRSGAHDAEAERRLEGRFATSRTLAVYGTLAPGRPNHHVVAPLGGVWTHGVVEGDLFPVGWGAIQGYPAFLPRSGGPAVAVHVLTSARLPDAWPALDRFEGAEYRRLLLPVYDAGAPGARRLSTIANLYAAADAGPAAP